MVAVRLAVGLVFVAAAAGKGRYFSQFVDYLRPVFAAGSRTVAMGVLAYEGIIAVLMPFDATARAGGIAGMGFLATGTALIAVRMSLREETACACFGAPKAPTRMGPGYGEMFRPAWYGLRNGALCLVVWSATQTNQSVGVGLAFFAACILVAIAGLVVSVVVEWRKLALPEHPRRAEFAPHLAPLVALTWYSDNQPQGIPWTVGRHLSPPN